jgi:small conductance mechanosensitive channel
MVAPITLPATLQTAAAVPATVKAALPALTVLLVNGALSVLLAVLILVAGWAVSRWFASWLNGVLGRSSHVDATLTPLLVNFTRYGILAITIVAVLSQFGVQTTSVIALLGAAGLAIGLALQGALSNVASGAMLLMLRPFKVGDYIVVGNNTGGTVREITLFTTILITPDKLFVSVPNSQIFGGSITNYTREETRRINIIVGIDYQDDIDRAQAILLEMMRADTRVLKTPEPVAPVNELGESSVNLIARCFVPNTEYWNVFFDFQKAIKQRFDAAGISIPFPQRVVSTRGPAQDALGDAPVPGSREQHLSRQ